MKKTILFAVILLFAVSVVVAPNSFPPCTGNYVAHCIDITDPDDCPDYFSQPEGFNQCHWLPPNGISAGCYPDQGQSCEPRYCVLWHEFGDEIPNQVGNGPWGLVESCDGDNCGSMGEGQSITMCPQGCENGVCLSGGSNVPEFNSSALIVIIAVIVIVAFFFIRKK